MANDVKKYALRNAADLLDELAVDYWEPGMGSAWEVCAKAASLCRVKEAEIEAEEKEAALLDEPPPPPAPGKKDEEIPF